MRKKGFASLLNQRTSPLLLLVGEGISPEVLAQDVQLRKKFGNLTSKNFIWIKVSRLDEFCNFPVTWTLRTRDGKTQRIYKMSPSYAKQGVYKGGDVLTSADLDLEKMSFNSLLNS